MYPLWAGRLFTALPRCQPTGNKGSFLSGQAGTTRHHTSYDLIPPLLVQFAQTLTEAVGTMTDAAGTHGDLFPFVLPASTPEEG